jgi:non-ribosomal peptide synthetase component F
MARRFLRPPLPDSKRFSIDFRDATISSSGFRAAGQNLAGGDDLIGHCANLLPLRQSIGDAPFAELWAKRSECCSSIRKSAVHLRQTPSAIESPTRSGRPPLVSVIFNLDPPLSDLQFGALKHELSLNPRRHYQFDLGFNLVDEPDGLRVECDYNPDLFDAGTIQRWLGHYRTLLRSITSGRKPQLLSAEEREQLLVTWNQTARPYPADEPITLAFERNAVAHPESIAVIEPASELRMAELNALANRWAHDLSVRVQRGDLVGLPAVRCTAFVAMVLGILKAGAAYVPLSPDDPPERRTRLAADCRIILELDAEPESNDTSNLAGQAGGGDAACVLFTSGSTGTAEGRRGAAPGDFPTRGKQRLRCIPCR